jgi:hypothetical protein
LEVWQFGCRYTAYEKDAAFLAIDPRHVTMLLVVPEIIALHDLIVEAGRVVVG